MRSSPMTGNNNNNNSASSETISCQDCGNKAKRDCEHRRCRTCCKTRGLPCPTHVKSTWVPVARRRQRQHHHQHHHHHHNLFNNLPLSLSTPTPFHHCLTTTSSSGQEGNFPAEVNSLATFKCIRVSSDDNVVEQYAYQTSINIGGHIFKGILYDQGTTTTAAGTTSGGGGDQSSSAGTSDYPHHHQFSITAATTAAAQTGDGGGGGGANVLYPPHPLYSTPFNAFLPGMQFFPHPRP